MAEIGLPFAGADGHLRRSDRRSPARIIALRRRWIALRSRRIAPQSRWIALRRRWIALRRRCIAPRRRWIALRVGWIALRAGGSLSEGGRLIRLSDRSIAAPGGSLVGLGARPSAWRLARRSDGSLGAAYDCSAKPGNRSATRAIAYWRRRVARYAGRVLIEPGGPLGGSGGRSESSASYSPKKMRRADIRLIARRIGWVRAQLGRRRGETGCPRAARAGSPFSSVGSRRGRGASDHCGEALADVDTLRLTVLNAPASCTGSGAAGSRPRPCGA